MQKKKTTKVKQFFYHYNKEGFVVKTLIYDFNEKTQPTTNSSDLQSDRLHAQH